MSLDDIKLCNCADCGAELASTAELTLLMTLGVRDGLPARLAGRMHGRPYCASCLATHRGNTEDARPARQQSRGELDGDNPWLEKATRDATEANDDTEGRP